MSSPNAGHSAATGLADATERPGATLWLPDGDSRDLLATSEAARLSQFWTYVVAERRRYSEEARTRLREDAQKHISLMMQPPSPNASAGARLDWARTFLQRVVDRPEIEVSIPYQEERDGWEWRTMPWESLLSLATKEWRGEKSLLVIRRMKLERPPVARPPEKLLVVVSSPGKLKNNYSFESEVRLVKSSFDSAGPVRAVTTLEDPTLEGLRGAVEQHRPDVIHLSVIDTHQAEELIGERVPAVTRGAERFDGICLRHPQLGMASYSALAMADTLTLDGQHRPLLVSFNCYNSGARLGALAVAQGAQAALGFQDTIDDLAAEEFFATFYRRWNKSQLTQLLDAFREARHVFKHLPPERMGGDVVLWTDQSLFAPPSVPATVPAVCPVAAPVSVPPPPPRRRRTRLPAETESPAAPPVAPPATPSPPGGPQIAVMVKPFASLNYSLLHNNGDLLEKFTIHNFQDASVDVRVLVKLHLDSVAFPFEGIFEVPSCKGISLADKIRVPLVAGLLRGQRESIQTNLFVQVFQRDIVLHSMSYPVVLLPADEWTDNDTDRQWLPSFVLPRDPAVLRVLDAATRYLRTLADDSRAGFDGYQAYDRGESDAGAKVDAQVRSLWSALLYDLPLVYINPPPTYTLGAQRLRLPSQVVAEQRATCIDLAVLIASCLEYVGIFPVVFLIQGHAFPGYWRDPRAREEFMSFGDVPIDAAGANDTGGTGPGRNQRPAWVFSGRVAFAEIAGAIQNSGLVPIETTGLTLGGSFANALEQGLKNLGAGLIFDAMIDLQKARDRRVTPLPLCGDLR